MRYVKEYANTVIKLYPEIEAQVMKIVHLHERSFISSLEAVDVIATTLRREKERLLDEQKKVTV